jgi:circadian clock protein KaiB
VDIAPTWKMQLYVVGATDRSRRAVANARRFCEVELCGDCDLQVIDLFEHPELAAPAQVVAAPTLVRLRPTPTRRVVGDLADQERLLDAFTPALREREP